MPEFPWPALWELECPRLVRPESHSTGSKIVITPGTKASKSRFLRTMHRGLAILELLLRRAVCLVSDYATAHVAARALMKPLSLGKTSRAGGAGPIQMDNISATAKLRSGPTTSQVQCILLICKHHLKDQFRVKSDGSDRLWNEPRAFCYAHLGYSLNEFRMVEGAGLISLQEERKR
jgi:hypothetical protein